MMKINNSKFTYESAVLEALTNMSEYDLQHRIIEPLLRLNDFQDVRDQSGRGEKGKDLSAIKYELGKPKLYAIQIKKIKLTGKSSGNKSLNNLV